MKENRRRIRFDVSVAAQLQGSATSSSSRISDISKGGCYVDTIAEVMVGQILSLKLLLADGEWLALEGIVAHQTSRLGFGVRFVNLDEKQTKQIRTLLGSEDNIYEQTPAPSTSDEDSITSEPMDQMSEIIM